LHHHKGLSEGGISWVFKATTKRRTVVAHFPLLD
jgi:hypothetical protein